MIAMGKVYSDIGIITFHCSDNYGAMLQAYGLKTYLCSQGIPADIIRYEPPFMTGRHWLFPYRPYRVSGSWFKCLYDMLGGFKTNVGMGTDFFRRRKNMKRFRKRVLINKRHPLIVLSRHFKRLPYLYYIVGSDQIWNPDITCGMREVYFGAFESRQKKKVIAYAASFGGESLPDCYDVEFSRLIKCVDAVSVREKEAISYVRRFYKGEVTAVLDPVFFLEKEVWQRVEKLPDRKGYICVYLTENNQELCNYVRRLSQDTGLPVVELSAGMLATQGGFSMDFTAGPAEFLGYIHKADYVITNSFHAIAFSIIFQKNFFAFVHSNRGARIKNILRIHGLENRLCQTGEDADIEACVDWEDVQRKTKENIRSSRDFLIKNLSL